MTAAADLLRRARERIATPERWTKGAYARDESGSDLVLGGSWRDEAVCMCADGALVAEGNNEPLPRGASLCLGMAARARGYEMVSKMNDAPETTHADVMALFDEAIALAEVPR